LLIIADVAVRHRVGGMLCRASFANHKETEKTRSNYSFLLACSVDIAF